MRFFELPTIAQTKATQTYFVELLKDKVFLEAVFQAAQKAFYTWEFNAEGERTK